MGDGSVTKVTKMTKVTKVKCQPYALENETFITLVTKTNTQSPTLITLKNKGG